MNSYLNDDLQIEFSFKGEMMQQTALTSFALYDRYRTSTAHKQ